MASKFENISKAREHWENRKVGRRVQYWTYPDTGAKLGDDGEKRIKGAIPKKIVGYEEE